MKRPEKSVWRNKIALLVFRLVPYCKPEPHRWGAAVAESRPHRRDLSEETRRLFKSDMRIVADFLAEGNNYRSDRKVIHKAALIKMIRVLSGESSVDDVEDWLEGQGIKEEDEVTVCELFDQYERKGRREGLKSGEAGRLVKDVESTMRFFKVTLEKACEGLGTTVSGYEEARKICFQEIQ